MQELKERLALWRDEQNWSALKEGFWFGLAAGIAVTVVLFVFVLGVLGPVIEIAMMMAKDLFAGDLQWTP